MFTEIEAQPQLQPQPAHTLPQTPYVTYTMIALNVIIFLLTIGQNSYVWGGNNHYFTIEQGEYYRIITSMFLHANLIHIGFNMYALYSIGRTLEGYIGHLPFSIVYFMGGLAGAFFSMTLNRSNISSVGASGAVVAVFAAEIVFIYRHRVMFGTNALNILQSTGLTILLNLAIGLRPGSGIDNWGHLGGFIGGVVVFFILDTFFIRFRIHPPTETSSAYLTLDLHNKPVLVGFLGAIAVIMLLFLSTITPLLTNHSFEDGNFSVEVPRGWVTLTKFEEEDFCQSEDVECLALFLNASGVSIEVDRFIDKSPSAATLNQFDASLTRAVNQDGGESIERTTADIAGHSAIQHVFDVGTERRIYVFIQDGSDVYRLIIQGERADVENNEAEINQFIASIQLG